MDRLLSPSDPILGAGFPLGRAGAALGPAPGVPREYAALLDTCGDLVMGASSKHSAPLGTARGASGSVTGVFLAETPGTAGVAGGVASFGRPELLRRALASDLASLADCSLQVHESLAELGSPVPLDEEELSGRQGGGWQGLALQSLARSARELMRRSRGAARHALRARAVGVEVEAGLDGALAFNARASLLLYPTAVLERDAARAVSLDDTIQAGLGCIRRAKPAADASDRAAAEIEMGSGSGRTRAGTGDGVGGSARSSTQGTLASGTGSGSKYAASLSPAQRQLLESRKQASEAAKASRQRQRQG